MQNSKKTIFQKEITSTILSTSFFKKIRNLYQGIRFISIVFVFSIFLSLFTSCNTLKKQVYFKDLPKDTLLKNIVTPDYEIKIRKGDVLGITVNSLSPDNSFYNSSPGSAGSSTTTATGGYPVDPEGNIKYVKIGIIHAEGMTRKELQDTLEKELIPYLKESVVTVTFLNRHVTILGAISPTVLPLVSDNMTILDALASTGDIGLKGRIDNILVVRDTSGAKAFKRLSLKDHSIFSSPYYYLQPNDIVYVEPTTNKTPLTALQIVSFVTTGISLLVLIFDRIL